MNRKRNKEKKITIQQKQDWYARIQRRAMRLLLRYDQSLFQRNFREFYAKSALPELPLLQQYDQYIKIVHLGDVLLDDIIPRIRIQHSLQTSHSYRTEQPPTQGRIHWRRTIDNGLRKTPGQVPLSFQTIVRQQTTNTPENILTVAILLNYQKQLQELQKVNLSDEEFDDYETRSLFVSDKRLDYELSAPYAQNLREMAQKSDFRALLDQVEAQLQPGANPYRDLIDWWKKLEAIRIGHSLVGNEISLVLANASKNMQIAAWHYEIWIALEYVHLLQQRKAILAEDIELKTDILQFSFTWKGQKLQFRYNRQREESAGDEALWENAPKTRPDYTIERTSSEVLTIYDENKNVIWKEPPIVLDAKYYVDEKEGLEARTHEPIKKLLGDMALLHAPQVILFFPMFSELDDEVFPRKVRPKFHLHHGGWQQNSQIQLYELRPNMRHELITNVLVETLDHALEHLPIREAPVCEKTLFNLTNGDSRFKQTNALCPKRHIGNGISDIVDTEIDCLKNPKVCHILYHSKK